MESSKAWLVLPAAKILGNAKSRQLPLQSGGALRQQNPASDGIRGAATPPLLRSLILLAQTPAEFWEPSPRSPHVSKERIHIPEYYLCMDSWFWITLQWGRNKLQKGEKKKGKIIQRMGYNSFVNPVLSGFSGRRVSAENTQRGPSWAQNAAGMWPRAEIHAQVPLWLLVGN